MVWIIDENSIFQINNDLDIKIKKIGNYNVIIVDNVYKYPDKVRELAIKSPATNFKDITHDSPGPRVCLSIDTKNIVDFCNFITERLFSTSILQKNLFIANIYSDDINVDCIKNRPHADNYFFAGVIYLNLPYECDGGTAFYKNKITNLQYQISDEPILFDKTLENFFLTESNKYWELIDIVEMKYNRLILYRANLFHSPYIRKGFFTKDKYRINQVLFFKNGINNNTIFFLNFKKDSLIFENNKTIIKTKRKLYPIELEKNFVIDIIKLIQEKKNFSELMSILSMSYELNNNIIINIKNFFKISCIEYYLYTYNSDTVQF
ncbi:MAG: hypothetical protein KatS3mg068_0526 [Candidatus Sericytochromatia bacterium]|nr:MAG: hypothetical protein KatS3mg068_0526 [Candidatus Sericytochromatia bacterium]